MKKTVTFAILAMFVLSILPLALAEEGTRVESETEISSETQAEDANLQI